MDMRSKPLHYVLRLLCAVQLLLGPVVNSLRAPGVALPALSLPPLAPDHVALPPTHALSFLGSIGAARFHPALPPLGLHPKALPPFALPPINIQSDVNATHFSKARIEALLERLPPGEAAFKDQMRLELSFAQTPSYTLFGDILNCLESRLSSAIPKLDGASCTTVPAKADSTKDATKGATDADKSSILPGVDDSSAPAGAAPAAAPATAVEGEHRGTNELLLATGGYDAGSTVASTSLFDYILDNWSASGDLSVPRGLHRAVKLPGSRRAMVAGGTPEDSLTPTSVYDSAEVFDAVTGSWAVTGPMATGRAAFGMVPLVSGQVLAAAGYGAGGALTACELYDPDQAVWSGTGALHLPRYEYTLTQLSLGKVLAAGGFDRTPNPGLVPQGSAEIYDFVRGRWRLTGSMISARAQHSAISLPDGKALVAGGIGTNAVTLNSAELYDSFTGLFYATGSLITARSLFSMVQLHDGSVLAAGGFEGMGRTATGAAEIYTPAKGVWTATGSLNVPRGDFAMSVLPDGTVIAIGGSSLNNADVASTEVYTPATGTWAVSASLDRPNAGAQAVMV